MDVPGLKVWIEDLSAENRGLKNEINSLKKENESLRAENDSLKKVNSSVKRSLVATSTAPAQSGTKVRQNEIVNPKRPRIQLSGGVKNDTAKIKDVVRVQRRMSTLRANAPGHKRHSTATTAAALAKKKAMGKSVSLPERNKNRKLKNKKVKIVFGSFNKKQDKARPALASDKERKAGDHPKIVTVTGTSTAAPDNKKREDDAEPEAYEVERILATRSKNGKRQFLIKWKGYDETEATWEPEENLQCQGLVEEFLKKSKIGNKEHLEKLKASGTGPVVEKKKMLYCTCRQPQNNRFMISCVCCGEWFHGKCVGVPTMGQWKPIQRTWLCPTCHELTLDNEEGSAPAAIDEMK